MSMQIDARYARVLIGGLLILFTVSITVLRVRAVSDGLRELPIVTRMYEEGRASAGALSNAQYHAAHARRSYSARWSVTGYATQGLIGLALGLAFVIAPRRRSLRPATGK